MKMKMKKGVNLGSIFLTFKEYKRFKVIKEYYYGFWDDSCFTSLQMTRSYSDFRFTKSLRFRKSLFSLRLTKN